MHPSEYQNIAEHEATYWWFICKRHLIRQSIERYRPAVPETSRMLDIGCGPGGNLAVLRQFTSRTIGFDFSSQALRFARQKQDVQLGQASVLQIPLAENSLELVTILDVLYHQWIADDVAALAECYRVLKPGGTLILTDSAFTFLSGPHDAANLTARRYTIPEMCQKLTGLGFNIEKASYLYALLFPLVFLRRWSQRKFGASHQAASDIQALPTWLNQTLLRLSLLEVAWLKRGNLPFGTSVYVVARKPDFPA